MAPVWAFHPGYQPPWRTRGPEPPVSRRPGRVVTPGAAAAGRARGVALAAQVNAVVASNRAAVRRYERLGSWPAVISRSARRLRSPGRGHGRAEILARGGLAGAVLAPRGLAGAVLARGLTGEVSGRRGLAGSVVARGQGGVR